MYYGALKKTDIANGPGVRVSLFVSGCTHQCRECFNPETWNFTYGKEYTDRVRKEILEALSPDYIQGLTVLGGEPFEPENQRGLLALYRDMRARYPKKNIWVYTGYTLERDLLQESRARIDITDEILSMINVLVDGEFILEKKNISLKFRVGERLAVVGENGSGKTTFIKLLCRLYDPTEGVILLNGIDIRKYNYREYLSVFSVVFQDFQLLSVSLGENVAAGSRDGKGTLSFGGRRLRHSGKEGGYDRDRVLDCVRMAGLSRWLDAQPEGLDTILYRDLDEKGVKISGGEAQKAAIARSLYHNAPFVILDEPTAALDPEAEYEIYTKFNEIVGDRTAVYISHRLSSCRFCDEIIVFGGGEILQKGSHEELLRDEEGKYVKLWNAQAQYYRKG